MHSCCKHDVLYKYQFSFRKELFTHHAKITLVDKVSKYCDNGDIMSVCIDTYIPLLLKTNSVCLNEKNVFFKKNVTFSAFLMSLIVSSACL